VIQQYQTSGLVEYAQFDFIYHAFITPNDPLFTNQWALNNTGQPGGTPDADIDAPEGWDIQSQAPNIVVAVTDTGARLTHEDLKENLWVNSGEIPGNGIDDDGNGYKDDVHGINAITESGDPSDDAGHGTHVAGIIGARGNNGKGVSGVAWQLKLMILKCLNSEGDGDDADALECLEYAKNNGAQIVNASWGDSFYSQALRDKIALLRRSGIIFVVAAGNDALDNDRALTYPACYDLDNIVSVAATTKTNTLAYFSCSVIPLMQWITACERYSRPHRIIRSFTSLMRRSRLTGVIPKESLAG
jgi:subtilisin family serine protease